MRRNKWEWILIITLFTGFLASCSKDEIIKPAVIVSDSFESGNIGEFIKVSVIIMMTL
jgi:hypothetical protein